ncbi:sigma-70 family RNA polymerase sigma factor [Prolixibacteraceae bacterium JC049]|nr:sigma-70 family RNA polymerase sigma factor [Prolixibacteraceae bacterium JC049]
MSESASEISNSTLCYVLHHSSLAFCNWLICGCKSNGNTMIEEVWHRFLEGDKNAFGWIYNHYIDDLFRYGTKLASCDQMVKDAIQEVFVDLFVRSNKEGINPQLIKYYLILALRRNIIRRLKNSRRFSTIDSNEIFEATYGIESQIIRNEEEVSKYKRMHKVLSLLTAHQREVIYLRFNESMEYDEIAKITNIHIDSVRKIVYRSLKKMKKAIAKESVLMFQLFYQSLTRFSY